MSGKPTMPTIDPYTVELCCQAICPYCFNAAGAAGSRMSSTNPDASPNAARFAILDVGLATRDNLGMWYHTIQVKRTPKVSTSLCKAHPIREIVRIETEEAPEAPA